MRSVQIALRKRPVEPERIERMVRVLCVGLKARASRRFPPNAWRNGDGRPLCLDQVGYVRFASVYRNFREAKDFEEFLGEMSSPTKRDY